MYYYYDNTRRKRFSLGDITKDFEEENNDEEKSYNKRNSTTKHILHQNYIPHAKITCAHKIRILGLSHSCNNIKLAKMLEDVKELTENAIYVC